MCTSAHFYLHKNLDNWDHCNMKQNQFTSHLYGIIVLLLISVSKVCANLNVNKTDMDTDLEACYKASLDPMYWKHPDKFLKAVRAN